NLERFDHLTCDGQLAADSVETRRENALQLRIIRIGRRQLAPDCEAFLVSRERTGAIADRQPHIADLVKGQRDIALPSGVVRITADEGARNGKTVHIARQRLRPRASGKLHVAEASEENINVALQ